MRTEKNCFPPFFKVDTDFIEHASTFVSPTTIQTVKEREQQKKMGNLNVHFIIFAMQNMGQEVQFQKLGLDNDKMGHFPHPFSHLIPMSHYFFYKQKLTHFSPFGIWNSGNGTRNFRYFYTAQNLGSCTNLNFPTCQHFIFISQGQ